MRQNTYMHKLQNLPFEVVQELAVEYDTTPENVRGIATKCLTWIVFKKIPIKNKFHLNALLRKFLRDSKERG